MYFRYTSLKEEKEKFENREVLSGFTVNMKNGETLKGHFWVVYGKKGRSVRIIPVITELPFGESELLCGMSYHQYRLSDDEDCVTDLTHQELDDLISD